MSSVIIFGAGATARAAYHVLKEEHDIPFFVADDRFCSAGQTCLGKRVLPASAFMVSDQFLNCATKLFVAIGYEAMNRTRLDKITSLVMIAHRAQFVSAIARSAVIRRSTITGKNSFIGEHSVIHDNSNIAEGAFIMSNVSVGHDCIIQRGAWINSNVAIAGGAIIGEKSFIGVGACIADGVKLAPRTYVGAGCVVSRDTKEGEVLVAPSPLTLVCYSDIFVAAQEALRSK